MRDKARLGVKFYSECTPGYYNNEGRAPTAAQRYNFLGFPGGPLAFFQYIDRWRTSGDFEGLVFR